MTVVAWEEEEGLWRGTKAEREIISFKDGRGNPRRWPEMLLASGGKTKKGFTALLAVNISPGCHGKECVEVL